LLVQNSRNRRADLRVSKPDKAMRHLTTESEGLMKIIFSAAIAGAGLVMLSASAGLAAMAASVPGGPAAGTRTPACAASQLGLAYVGGLASAGNDFGTIVVWDKSAIACSLTSPIKIAGLNLHGHRVTPTESFRVSGADVLTPRGRKPVRLLRLRPGEKAAFITLSAEYRDVSSGNGGLCSARHQIEPATWRGTLATGGVRRVANRDRHEDIPRVRTLPRDHGMLTCRGELNTPIPVTVGAHAS
jgi:hypothetical protein